MDNQKQICLQVALNPENKSHMDLLEWIDEETKNRSSFIRETLFLRKMGMIGSAKSGFSMDTVQNDISVDDVMSIINV
ncbi:hypothetical protein BC351_00440 [Paenibacillus ferrarius]|uniref:Uncharacterized protein n=1 Tax=Paenibacillus ferrarius TaxID=1469647 RepID=A0A1V4HS27_9BACL|nr:hypothetical protein [Paenibacillus ferrarius]OPH61744.1 hypothetical protein BC351_00440 [Paenibacillus ferrarius]